MRDDEEPEVLADEALEAAEGGAVFQTPAGGWVLGMGKHDRVLSCTVSSHRRSQFLTLPPMKLHEGQIDTGYVDRWNAHGETVQAPFQFRDD